jgi:hypothetical protein
MEGCTILGRSYSKITTPKPPSQDKFFLIFHRGCFSWRVKNFTKLIEETIYSDKFIVGKYEW